MGRTNKEEMNFMRLKDERVPTVDLLESEVDEHPPLGAEDRSLGAEQGKPEENLPDLGDREGEE